MMNEHCCTDNEADSLCSQPHDALSPIFRLPFDILAEIFILCAHDYNPSPTRTVPEWVNVSYVCSQWRIIALDLPVLWSYLFNVSRRWTEELLFRSEQTLLKIWVYLRPHEEKSSIEFLEQVAGHAERIQTLRLRFPPGGGDPKVLAPLQKPSLRAPNLQVLEAFSSWVSFSFDQGIFGGKTPSLRQLKLSIVGIPWYSFHLGSLESLSLFTVTKHCWPNMTELWTALSHMSNIVHLTILGSLSGGVSDFMHDTGFIASHGIHFPRLSRLHINAPQSTVTTLLSLLNIPLSTEMKLECDAEIDGTLDDYLLFASLLARRFNSSGDQPPLIPIRTLFVNTAAGTFAFSTSEHAFMAPRCDHGLLPDEEWHWGCNTPFYLRMGFNLSTEEEAMKAIYHSVCVKGVQSLLLRNLGNFPRRFWHCALGHFQELRYLKLHGVLIPDLVAVISGDDTKGRYRRTNTNLRPPHMPVLEDLELVGVGIKDILCQIASAIDLQEALCLRKARGQAIKRLSFSNCDPAFGQEEISQLDDVDEIWWEGKRVK